MRNAKGELNETDQASPVEQVILRPSFWFKT